MKNICLYNDNLCVKTIDFLSESSSDSEAIDKAITYAKENHIDTLLIDEKDWVLDHAIEVPSNKTVIVDGVLLKLADKVLDNVFRPEGMVVNPDEPYGFPFEIIESQNIRILGKNGAVLEGPDILSEMFHPTFQKMQLTECDRWGWRGFIAFFSRCNGFELSGFKIQKTRSWAISIDRSQNGYLHDLEIYSTCRNGDGINLRIGCSRIWIENIKAKTSDDCIALNTLEVSMTNTYPHNQYVFPLIPSNYLMDRGESIEDRHIHDIYIRNVVSSTDHYSQAVTLFSRHGHKIYNVFIRDIFDGNPVIFPPKRIDMVGVFYSVDADFGDDLEAGYSDIQISNVHSNSAKDAVVFLENIDNLSVTHVIQNCPNCSALKYMNEPLAVADIKAVSGEPITSSKGYVHDLSTYTTVVPYPEV